MWFFNWSILTTPILVSFIILSDAVNMSARTVLNEQYKGLVESVSIPAQLHERDGRRYASSGGVVPIHCCTQEEIESRATSTHHYCDIFSDSLLAPVDELAYVRLDDTHAEKVFINRNKRVLLTSSDGRLAQWRSAPSFESANRYLAGAPVVDKQGRLVSVVTARLGNHYAVSNFEGDGGYFETPLPWSIIESEQDTFMYGTQQFPDRESLSRHISSLPPPPPPAPVASPSPSPPRPVLRAPPPSPAPRVSRVALVTGEGRQIVHLYLHNVNASGVQYL